MTFLDMQELVHEAVLTGETTGLTLTGETYGGSSGIWMR